jgi:uncharacterized membrane protein YeiB
LLAQAFFEEERMAANRERTRSLDVLQGMSALGGITLGLIPLVGLVVGAESGGLLGRIFGWSPSGSLAWVLPVVIIAVAIGVIAILEVMKRA